MRCTLSCLSLVCKTRWAGLFSSYCTLANTMCVCVHACFHIVLHICIWNSVHTLGAHACLSISLCLLPRPMSAGVGQVSASITASLTRSFFTSLLTHVLMHTVSSFGSLPGDVLAAPESALCGWIGVILSRARKLGRPFCHINCRMLTCGQNS